MNVLIDNRWFGETGIGRYAREILERKPASHRVTFLDRNWKIKNPVSPWLLGEAANNSDADLFWSPGFMPPAHCKIPFVVTIHDLIHLHYGTSLHQLYYNQILRRLLRSASTIFTVSEYSRNEILAWSGLSAQNVRAIPLAVSDDFTAQGEVFRPGYPYILYVGNRRVYKNIHRLIEAFGLGCTNRDIRLALSGFESPELLLVAKKFGVADRLVFLGRIEEAYLPAVYRGALAVAYVSLYEGFGLPPLEAMACGAPVIASNVTSIPEVVGDAAVMVDPHNVEEIACGLKCLTEDDSLRGRLIPLGLDRARKFNWESTAEITWNTLLEVRQA
jgi:glycosyltransferase involved in cell wall biosynthesis